MRKKLTLNEKKLINEHVTGETKRCLAILNRMENKIHEGFMANNDPDTQALLYDAIREIIKESPYIEFHPELYKRIPK